MGSMEVGAIAAIGSIAGAAAVWYLWKKFVETDVMCSCGHNCEHGLSGHELCSKVDLSKEQVCIYVAKKIVTMDPTWPEASAVATCKGRILSVGSLDDMKVWCQGGNVVVDRTFEDKVLVPGFIEPHIHPLVGGVALSLPNIAYHDTPNPWGDDIKGCKTKATALARLIEYEKKLTAKGNLDGDMIAWGWDSIAMDDHLTRFDLDCVSTKRNIAVWDCSMHFSYTNSQAIKSLGITPSKCKGISGAKLDENGEVLGQFLGIDSMQLVRPLFAKVGTVSFMLKAMTHLTELARQGGITLMGEMMQGAFSLPLEERLWDVFFNDPSTPVRCTVVVDAKKQIAANFGSTRMAVRNLRAKQRLSTEKLIYNNGVKFVTDDAFFGLTMQMNFPGYIDMHQGIWNNEPGSEYVRLMEPWWRAGARIHVHSNGDAAQDVTLKCLKTLQTRWPRFDHRFCFEHFGISNQSLVTRVKALGANVSVNPFYAHNRAEINEKHLGVDRAHAAARLKMLVDAGICCAMHTDTPVAPPRPLHEISIAVNRNSSESEGLVLAPCERVTKYQALRMKTIHAAQVLDLDGLVGSIEPGKLADFTVLYENPLEVDDKDLAGIKIWGTVLGGKKVPLASTWYQRGGEHAEPGTLAGSPPPPGFWKGLIWLLAQTSSGWTQWALQRLLNSSFLSEENPRHQENPAAVKPKSP